MGKIIPQESTLGPHTFYLKRNGRYKSIWEYIEESRKFVESVRDTGIKARISEKCRNGGMYTDCYITFRSKYDTMAFKLGWL